MRSITFVCALAVVTLASGCARDRERSPMELDCSRVGCAAPPPPGEECTAPCGCCSTAPDGGPLDGGLLDGEVHDASSGESVACGSMTCGPGQYCLIECTCCGAPSGDGGPPPSANYSCHSIPPACDAADLCSCSISTPCGTGYCTTPLTVECPCA